MLSGLVEYLCVFDDELARFVQHVLQGAAELHVSKTAEPNLQPAHLGEDQGKHEIGEYVVVLGDHVALNGAVVNLRLLY